MGRGVKGRGGEERMGGRRKEERERKWGGEGR